MSVRAVVVFDGECGLCNGFVAWLIRRDKRAHVAIIGSASPVAHGVLERAGVDLTQTRSTIVVWDGVRAWTMSAALVRIMRILPWPTRVLSLGAVVPRPWRDGIYRWVAARRPRVEADDAGCGVPPAHLVQVWRERLADHSVVEALAHRASQP